MKRKASALALGVALGSAALCMAPQTAYAQAVVIDPANLQQAIVRYMAMIQQLEQLKAQLEQAKQEYASITGSRGLGAIDAENYTANIPTNWHETLAAMQNGGQVGALANQIRNEASELNQPQFANVDPTVVQALTTHLNDAATAQALNAQTYDDSGTRFQRLTDLMNQINGTTDMKSIGELQARIEIENGMLLNELIKLQSMNSLIDNNRRVQQQKETQDDYQLTAAKY
ncbi:MAG: Minor pilin of type IV secretion complex, VirB5 [Rhodanobacteraceae bacterium]|jgi:type IV secretion system protein VirB5|nr:MAG: Minor pilin of type IV secretion complex, VirB5 [Rhodanobacteraceae bacterium]